MLKDWPDALYHTVLDHSVSVVLFKLGFENGENFGEVRGLKNFAWEYTQECSDALVSR
jgi:hypothetical protein